MHAHMCGSKNPYICMYVGKMHKSEYVYMYLKIYVGRHA